MTEKKHVLFVCTGNTCRSPMAEGLFKKAIVGRKDYEMSSAGIAATRGAPCNPETVSLLKKRKIELTGFGSRLVTEEILKNSTHVFAMTQAHLDALESRFPQYAYKFFLMCEFVNIPGQGLAMDIPDPIGMGRSAYEGVAEVFDQAIPTLIAYMDQTSR